MNPPPAAPCGLPDYHWAHARKIMGACPKHVSPKTFTFISSATAGLLGPASRLDLQGYCFLDDVDRQLAKQLGDANRLGFSPHLVTLHYIGTFHSRPP